ncbi:MAG: glycosyltransferase [Vicinamibacterales bacterium]
MNTLFVGVGAGSWDVRGRQLGGAVGARVTIAPTAADLAWADVVVLVKRAIATFGAAVRRCGRPAVWDVLDVWQQPTQNAMREAEAVALVRRVAWPGLALIGATKAMAGAIGGTYLPHHAWPGLTPAPAREHVRVVAYQGAPHYLGRWAGWLATACGARGWQFVINPKDLREADILVAFRDGPWDGWICREWKSGVKVVNALAAGRPILGQPSAAMREIGAAGTVLETPEALNDALETWADYEARARVAEVALDRSLAYRLDSIATMYRTVLEAQACPA